MNSRTRAVRRVLWIVLALNIAVACAKFFYGLITNSSSMQADGIHSMFDSLGNVIGLVGVAIAARPADKSHPYGHSKFETYGSLLIGVLLLVAAAEVSLTTISKIVDGNYDAQVGVASFVVMVSTLVVNLFVTVCERKAGKRLDSEILKADAAHTFSDALVSIGVIIGLAFVYAGFPQADAIVALIVVVFILASAVQVFKGAIDTLSDHSRIPASEIADIAKSLPGVEEVHHIRTRGTESEIYCDLHLLVDPDMKVKDAHLLGDKLEQTIKQKFPNVSEVLVHIEPLDESQIDDRKTDIEAGL